jgi:SpoVK/Ycf46/Vps4 family AAA+-type ATPase
VPLVATSVSTWLQGGHLNDVIANMAKTFAEARAIAPSILFIDEIDGIGKRQPAEREYADYWNTVVNKALELLDGAVKSEGLIIVGATNRPDQIDDAIKRSGRLETHIEIPMPDVATLAAIFIHRLGDDLAMLVGDAGKLNGAAHDEVEADVAGMHAEGPPPPENDADTESDAHGPGDTRKGTTT